MKFTVNGQKFIRCETQDYPNFCSAVILSNFMAFLYSERPSRPLSADDILDNIIRGVRYSYGTVGTVFMADWIEGVARMNVFNEFHDGKIYQADGSLWKCQKSDFYTNPNSHNRVQHLVFYKVQQVLEAVA